MSQALGLIEVRGYVAAVAAADAAVKAAGVTIEGWELTKGSALILVKIRGEIGAVQAAVDAAGQEAARLSTIIKTHVIPRPHDELAGRIIK